jgi:hypothetical protein
MDLPELTLACTQVPTIIPAQIMLTLTGLIIRVNNLILAEIMNPRINILKK